MNYVFFAANPIIDSYFQSDLFGKGIFLALFILSILTWVLFLKKSLYIKTLLREGMEIEAIVHDYTQKPLALNLSQKQHPFADLYSVLKKKSVEILQKNHDSHGQVEGSAYLYSSDIALLDAHLDSLVSKELNGLEKDLFVLSTVISLAPFLGLLGTVWGILLTFTELHANHLMEKSTVVMGGLSMALGTTVVGLLVAIPALISYNYLKSKLSSFETRFNDFGTVLLNAVEIQYRRNDK